MLSQHPPTRFRFPDEAVGIAALAAAGLMNDSTAPATASHSHAMDVIGYITQGGEWDEQGNAITPPQPIPGWHVNFVGLPPDGWAAYEVQPQNPYRVWFGEVHDNDSVS